MEQKKSDRAARGSNAWQPQARQQELDEADRFQVPVLLQCMIPLHGPAQLDLQEQAVQPRLMLLSSYCPAQLCCLLACAQRRLPATLPAWPVHLPHCLHPGHTSQKTCSRF